MKTSSTSGFSLLEMALLLVIYGGIAAMAVTAGLQWLDQEEVKSSKRSLKTVERALASYAKINGRLPCPGDLTIHEDSDYYGFEAAEITLDSGTTEPMDQCGAGGNIASVHGGDGVYIGSVPARTLGLPESAMRDSWGGHIIYMIDQSVTRDGSLNGYAGHTMIEQTDDSESSIIVQSDASGTVVTNNAMYALISFGPNQHGALNKNHTRIDHETDVSAEELENCDCDNTATPTGADRVIVTRAEPGVMDDLVVYKLRSQLIID